MVTRWLENDNGKISYEDNGSGPLVICIPSVGDVRAEYRFLAPRLVEAGYRVVLMDMRGHGESSTNWDDFSVVGVGRDLLALIRRLQAGPAAVIGTSMGAGAAAWAAVEEPGSISALALIGPAVHGEPGGAAKMLYRAMFARPWGPAVWLTYYATLYTSRKPQDFAEYKSALLRNMKQPGRIEATLKLALASKAASEQRLGQVSAPVRIIMGSKDPDFKDQEAEARWVAEQMHGEYIMVEGAGHYPHAEMPEISTPLVLDFLRQHQPQLEKEYA
jgi:pimeloyl-ACP methyl ester carboxylesterase